VGATRGVALGVDVAVAVVLGEGVVVGVAVGVGVGVRPPWQYFSIEASGAIVAARQPNPRCAVRVGGGNCAVQSRTPEPMNP
jgi:hypothetical protein